MIELTRLCAGYRGEAKLFDAELTVPDQSVCAVVGPNGCGKSTLLKAVAGLIPPLSGQVRLDGVPVAQIGRKALAQQLSFLPQGRNLPGIRVESLVLHGRFPYLGYPRRYRPEDRRLAEQAMEWAGVLPLREREMSELSGGERQKAYLAMVLAQDTKTVLLDEPTTYLDIACQLEIMRLARRMQRAGKTVVMVLHDLNLALRYADTVAVMQGGRLLAADTPEAIYESGVLERVFSVRVRCVREENGRQYFFEPPDEARSDASAAPS